MKKLYLGLLGLALGVAAVIAFSGPARADIVKCQNKLENKTTTMQYTLLKDLYWVADKLRKGPINSSIAPSIEAKLAGFYGTGKTADKFRIAIEALVPATCTADDLSGLGFLLSGGGSNCAPGTSVVKFAEDILLLSAESASWSMLQNEAPMFANQLQQFQLALGCPVSAYPNICALKDECSERTCMLGTPLGAGASTSMTHVKSWALASTANSTLSIANNMNMCFVDGDLKGTEPGYVYITAAQGRGLGMIDLGGGIWVCVDTLRANGYCDCGATTHAGKNVTDCQDRDIYHHSPGEPGTGCPSGPASTGTDACLSNCSAALVDVNYPGGWNGLPNITCSSTRTGLGDCVDSITNQFTVVTNAFYGTDGRPCTSDDTGGVNSPTSVVLTTGTSQSAIYHAVKPRSSTDFGYGTCVADGTTPCVSHCQNRCLTGWCEVASTPTACSAKAPCDETCTASNYEPTEPFTVGPNSGKLPTLTGTFPYAANACDLYRQNHLQGMRLTGSFPGTASADAGGLGDNLNDFFQDCK